MLKLTRPHSIRWRLALSYAAIALLAALALGAVLLAILRGYYTQRELDYLNNNAYGISLTAAELTAADPSSETLQLVVKNLSFLSQTRVRLLDLDERVLADSGVPRITDVTVGAIAMGAWRDDEDRTSSDYMGFISVGDVLSTHVVSIASELPNTSPTLPASIAQANVAFKTVMVVDAPYGVDFVEMTVDGQRSDQIVRRPFYDEQGHPLGYVELSSGPAYGRDIVNSVAWGWSIASVAAVALAAGAGWFLSRRISAPVLALTHVTARMAHGHLSARADPAGRDELGRLARSFNTMADQVESTITTLRRFVADAAHELHTPLTALRTNLELAAPDEHTVQALAQVARLEALTQGLLDLSRAEAVSAAHAPVDLTALVNQASEVYASQAEQAGLSFELTLPAETIVVQGDTAQLRRAIGNLLDNAIKFTPEGGTARLGLRLEEDCAVVWIEDNGIGIPPDDVPHLFSRFHRGRNAAAFPGSGLGLAIVKAVAEAHGGSVSAGNISQGARLTFRLPIRLIPR